MVINKSRHAESTQSNEQVMKQKAIGSSPILYIAKCTANLSTVKNLKVVSIGISSFIKIPVWCNLHGDRCRAKLAPLNTAKFLTKK